MSSRVYQ